MRLEKPALVLGLLTTVFFLLRLFGVVDWPWVWVFSPIWIPGGLALIGSGLALVWVLAEMAWKAVTK